MVPAKVDLGEKVVQVSAGDSHTAALTDQGAVYVWGSFRVSIAFLYTVTKQKYCTSFD